MLGSARAPGALNLPLAGSDRVEAADEEELMSRQRSLRVRAGVWARVRRAGLLMAVAAALVATPVAAQQAASRGPAMSSLRAADRLGQVIWTDPNEDAIPQLDIRLTRPNFGGVHITRGSAEDVLEWLGQWGDVETGPGPNSRR